MTGDGGAWTPLERERVVEALCEHYALDRLEMEEFERRVERAHRARTREELRSLLADLPALDAGPPAPAGMGSGGMARSGSRDAARPGSGGVALPGRVDPSRVPDRQTELAIWSGRVRKGAWVPARKIRAFGFMGGVELDFREALLSGETIQIEAGAVMGAVEIVVPPGVRVQTEGFAFMGAFEENTEAAESLPADAPLIRVSGFAFMGGVDVTSRYPGETPREARRRRKEAARRRLTDGG
jgi:hypothetical protein